MKLGSCIAAVCVLISAQAAATGQRPDEIRLDGTVYPLLSDAFAGSDVDYFLLQGPYTGTTCSSNWRGYTATWSVDSEQLFLLKVQAGSCGIPTTEIPLDSIFSARTPPIAANWYSGQLLVLLTDPETLWNPYKLQDGRFLALTVSKGRVIMRQERDARPK
jgi:hypothetical protein